MALEIVEIHPANDPKELNTEWFIVENKGDEAVALRACTVGVARPNARKINVSVKMDPGFLLEPKSRKRIVSGNPATKAHGKAVEDDVENYFLFMKVPLLPRGGESIRLMRGQAVLAQAVFVPGAQNGIGE